MDDAYCEALGAGVTNEGQICDMTGTSSRIMLCLNRGTHLMWFPMLFPIGTCHLPMSSTGDPLLGFGNICWRRAPIPWIFDIEDALRLSPSGAHGLIFFLTLGERSPIWDKHAKGVFFGITKKHSKPIFSVLFWKESLWGCATT